MAVGDDVKGWKQGDRVCASYHTDQVHGDISLAVTDTALGGPIHGVLTEYRTFPAHVRLSIYLICFALKFESNQSLVAIPNHLSYEEASTLPYVLRASCLL